MSALILPETMKAHRAVWWVWTEDGHGNRVKIRHRAAMRGLWGYDVSCSCGEFETATGGATRNYVSNELWHHRYEAQQRASQSPYAEAPDTLPALPVDV